MRVDLAQAARLDPSASRIAFRTMLDALARPGSVLPLQLPHPEMPPPLVVLLALADAGTRVAVLGDEGWADLVVEATGAGIGSLEDADLVAALHPPTPDQVRRLRTGDALRPERGAVLAVGCSGFMPGPEAGTVLTLEGPGVESTAELTLAGVAAELLHALSRANRNFPAGVDAFFLSPNWLAAIPRSARIQVVGSPAAGGAP